MSAHVPALSTEGGSAHALVDAHGADDAGSADARFVPSPNVAELAGAAKTSERVRIRHRRTIVASSEQPLAKAAQPLVGAVSGAPFGKVVIQGGSSKVYAELKRVGTLGTSAAPANTPRGQVVVPSQTQIKVAP